MFKKFLLSFMCLLIGGCYFNLGAIPGITVEQKLNINTTYDSVVKILAKDIYGNEALSGSGFAINKNQIMTAGHVCRGIIEYQNQNTITKEIYINFYAPDKETILESSGAMVLKIDETNDICILYKQSHGIAPVKFVKNYSSVKVHSTVFIVGAPLGVFATSYAGHVVIKDDNSINHFLIVSAPAAPGNSGSPVFNNEGLVVGMLVAGPSTFEHLSMCVASPFLVGFVRNVK